MTKKKQKKPTLNEVKQVVENLIHDLNLVNHKVDSLGMVFEEYVKYCGERDKFLEHLKSQKEKVDDKQGTIDKDSE